MSPRTPQFQPGDVVRLATGGPLMTVRAQSGQLAYCVWTEGTQHRQGTFEQGALRLAAAPPTASPTAQPAV